MNTTITDLEPAIMGLLGEAADWRLISLLFECPGADWLEQVTALAPHVTDPALKAAVVKCADASPGLHHTTFGPGGPAGAREVSYHEHLLPGTTLAELAGFYGAFAYQPAAPEPPDHVAVEAGFVAYLRVKEAYARMRGDACQQEVCAEASRSFVHAHLRVLAHPLAEALAASGVEYLALAAEALRSRVGAPPPSATPLAVISREDDETSICERQDLECAKPIR